MSFLLPTFGTLYYFFLTGYFAYRLSFPTDSPNIIELFCASLLLSISINSLTVYLLNRAFDMPFTLQNVILTASGILIIILSFHLILPNKKIRI